jgi:hypothetical protein
MRRIAFMCGGLVLACGGRLAGDPGKAADAGESDTSTLEVDGGFICGEGNVFVICTGECILTRTQFHHDYVCRNDDAGLPCTVSTASAPGDCGCYLGPHGEAYLTICN